MQGATVSFGIFNVALVATAGVVFAAGILGLLLATRERREHTSIAFALLCFAAAAMTLGRVGMYTAGSLPDAISALRFTAGSGLVVLPALMWFVAAYTGRPLGRALTLVVLTLAGVMFFANLWLPWTVLDIAITPAAPLVLPWGEALYQIDTERSWSGRLYYAGSYAVFFWAIWRGLLQYRAGERRRAGLLLACLLVQFLAVLWTLFVVDTMGWSNLPALEAFAFLLFVLLMGLSLVDQMHQHVLTLERTSGQLQLEAQARRQAESELYHAAGHDALTGLPNRTRALEALAQLLREAQRARLYGSVLMLDLDNFKTINDSLGHAVGDRVLEVVADRLLTALPEATVVARLGGDEFTVLLRAGNTSSTAAHAQAMRAAQRALASLAPTMTAGGRVLAVGASIGVAVYPEGEMAAADILRCADIALYRAKHAGRHTIRRFEPRMQHDADTRLELERGLRLAAEREELRLHFQPQVDQAGQLVGAEALLRWHSSELGTVSPETFIPVAEEAGLIHALGAWVIRAACAQLRDWHGSGLTGLHLAINVSAWQLAHPQFAQQIAQLVRAAGVDPAMLTLELTESALLNDFETALQGLRSLAEAGFRLSLDDFGTGYSSLAYLQQLPLDELKIDRSFISVLRRDTNNPLAGFIIDVGHRLGLTTIAEGIETERERAILAALGCERLQGYLISPPLPAREFRAWVTRRNHRDKHVADG